MIAWHTEHRSFDAGENLKRFRQVFSLFHDVTRKKYKIRR